MKQSHSSDELPSQVPRDQLQDIKTSPTKQPPPGPQQLSPSSSGSKYGMLAIVYTIGVQLNISFNLFWT